MENVTNISNQDDNNELLVKKVNSLEKELFSEQIKSKNLEEEINILNSIKIPVFIKTLEEKDDYIDSLLVEQIKLQKEINYLKDNFNSTEGKLDKMQLSKYFIPELQEEKDKLIMNQTNKIDYLNFVYKDTKAKLRKKEEEYEQQITDLNTKIKSQEEQISNLKK